jgi:signal transduction histidine kinase
MNIRANISLAAAAIGIAFFSFTSAWPADEPTNKDEVVAMVQKAVAAIKSRGAEKAYAELVDKSGQFVRGDFYIPVIGLDGKLLAYGADSHLVGDNVMAITDGDGREIIKEQVQLARKQQSFWQSYKFMNPVTKTVEPKEMYCERLDETVVCGGLYL